MPSVYFTGSGKSRSEYDASEAAARLMLAVSEREGIPFGRSVPLKVHFGERGNESFIRPALYDGIIDALLARGVASSFMETSVLYAGPRMRRESHARLAAEHGFTRLPVVIADGEAGESFYEVPIGKKHFKSCKLGAAFRDFSRFVVLSHFKGHRIAGFGGAIKQLSMGFAAKGGKLAMHMGIKPFIFRPLCRRCGLCAANCPVHAIAKDGAYRIDAAKCIGCGACFALCPHKAVSIYTPKSIVHALLRRGDFLERLAEYAYAAALGRRNIYVSYAMNVTANCDCIGKKMSPLIPDVGIFASADPVALDAACLDAAAAAGARFKGRRQLEYAEEIGLGSAKYELISI